MSVWVKLMNVCMGDVGMTSYYHIADIFGSFGILVGESSSTHINQ